MASAGDKLRASSEAKIGAFSSGTSNAQHAERPLRWQLARISRQAEREEDKPFCGKLIWTSISKPMLGNTKTIDGDECVNIPWYITNVKLPDGQVGYLPRMVIDVRVVELLPIFASRVEQQDYDTWLASTEAETLALGEPYA